MNMYIFLLNFHLILFLIRTTEKEDMENKYNRVVTSSLLALRKELTSLPSNQTSSLSECMDNLLKDAKFWKHGKSQVISVSICFLILVDAFLCSDVFLFLKRCGINPAPMQFCKKPLLLNQFILYESMFWDINGKSVHVGIT